MTILEAIEHPVLQLPKPPRNEDYPAYLTELFNSYIETVERIKTGSIVPKISDNLGRLKNLCDSLVRSSSTYYQGYPAESYQEFETAINDIVEFLFPKNKLIGNPYGEDPYYRARPGSAVTFERKEMFHVPFEKREFVSTQRYSIPGLPCLYLSNSVYACWEELGRPDFDKMMVTKLKVEKPSLNFLDISTTPSFLVQMLKATTTGDFLEEFKQTHQEALDRWDQLTLSYIMKWPLMAACSIKARYKEGSFKPEYIFPQFLIQYVTRHRRIDGVKYFSIEAHLASGVNNAVLINYAIPVKEASSTGLCRALTGLFSLTDPISWEILTKANPNINEHDHEKFESVMKNLGMDTMLGTVEIEEGKQIFYWHTNYGKLEIALAEMPFEKI